MCVCVCVCVIVFWLSSFGLCNLEPGFWSPCLSFFLHWPRRALAHRMKAERLAPYPVGCGMSALQTALLAKSLEQFLSNQGSLGCELERPHGPSPEDHQSLCWQV